jgi:hypothetical protein
LSSPDLSTWAIINNSWKGNRNSEREINRRSVAVNSDKPEAGLPEKSVNESNNMAGADAIMIPLTSAINIPNAILNFLIYLINDL